MDEREVRRRLMDLADQAPPFAGLPAARTAPAARRSTGVWVLAAAAVVVVLVIVPAAAFLGGSEGDDDRRTPSVAESSSEDDAVPTTAGQTASEATSPTPPVEPGQANKDEVRAVGQDLDRTGDPNFGKVVLDLNARLVTVYWKGGPPDDIAEQEGVRPNGVVVRIAEAAYSTSELEQAGERILDDGRTPSGVRVTHVRPAPDLSGLLVGYTPENMPSTDDDREALRRRLEQVTGGIPVEFEPGVPDVGLVPET